MRIVIMIFLFIYHHTLLGQCCSGGVPMSGNVGMPVQSKGVFQANLNYDLNVLRTFKSGAENLNDNSRTRRTQSVLFEIGYSFTERFSVDGFFSYVRQERIIETFYTRNETVTSGLGDGLILLKYQTPLNLTVGYGLKAPLGSADEKNEIGLTLNADLQPGSGAWDHILYFNYSNYFQIRPTLNVFGTSIIRLTGTNTEYLGNSNYTFGNEYQLLMGLSDRFLLLNQIFDASLIFRYRFAEKDQFNGEDFPSSGGRFLFINPGLSYQLTPQLALQYNMAFPVHSYVQDSQLSPTFRINTGIYFQLKPIPQFTYETDSN